MISTLVYAAILGSIYFLINKFPLRKKQPSRNK